MNPRVWIEQGVLWDLQPVTLEGFRQVVRYWRYKGWLAVYVTSGREGTTHLPHSYHHCGRAFDISLPEEFTEEDRVLLKERMGPGWVIINEGTHLHFQINWRD